MVQSCFKYLFATSVKYSDFKISPFVHKMAKMYPFHGRGFHTPVEWKIGYYVIKKQIIIQILILNTAFYVYGNMRLKDISILNLFEQIQENTISDSAFSARLGSARQLGRGFHTRPLLTFINIRGSVLLWRSRMELTAQFIVSQGIAQPRGNRLKAMHTSACIYLVLHSSQVKFGAASIWLSCLVALKI